MAWYLARLVSHDDEGLYFPQDLPTGIRLAVQQAECSDPVMVRQKRWEAGNIHYPSLIKEGDRYRLWYCCFADPDDPWVKAGHVPGKVPGLWCYAEIVDGSLPNRTSAALVPALEGFSFADCARLSGGELAAVVSWRASRICRR